jgi:glycosyltransferase involved in cell wall biosynthesis
MNQRLEEMGWKFEVWFMASSESGRHWNFGSSEFQFPYRFLSGRPWRIGSDSLYWNREVSNALHDADPDILLIAGGWVHPTVLLAALSSAPERTIFWSESHLESIRRTGFVAGLARRWMLSRFSEFAVPGALARKYVEHHAHAARIHFLPNLVDSSVFYNQVRMCRGAADNDSPRTRYQDRRVMLIVARLSEEKGLLPFLEGMKKLGPSGQDKLTVLIAGSGQLRRPIEQWINHHRFDVQLLGHQTESQLTKLYAQADGFCLPSLSDPNPISVIEALWAGLPLLLSSRVGNHPECLQIGRNGFLFDSGDPESVAQAISQWLALSPAELTSFGENSLQIARASFDPDTVIPNFLEELLDRSARQSNRRLERVAAAG